MADGTGEKLASIYIEAELIDSKYKKQLNDLEKETQKKANDIEKRKPTLTFDDRLAKKKLSELAALRDKLQKKFEQKIAIDAKASSINATKNALNSVERQIAGINTEAKKTPGIFSKIKGVLAGFGATLGIYKLVQVLREATEVAIKQKIAEEQVAQAVKRTGEAAGYSAKQLFLFAAQLQKITGIGDEDIMQSVINQLLTFGNLSGDVFKRATKAILDMNAVIGRGEVSALTSQSIQLAKALNDPILGITALRRVGVAFTAQAQEQIKTLVQQNKIFEAQDLILKEVEKEFSGQAQALNEATGGVKNFHAAWGDFLERIGTPLLSVFGGLLRDITSLITPTRTFTENQKEANNEARDSILRFDALAKKYIELRTNTHKSAVETFEYKKVIGELQRLYPNYLKNIDLETSKVDDVKRAFIGAREELNNFLLSKINLAIVDDLKDQLGEVVIELAKQDERIEKARQQLQDALDGKYVDENPNLYKQGLQREIKQGEERKKVIENNYNNVFSVLGKAQAKAEQFAKEHNIITPTIKVEPKYELSDDEIQKAAEEHSKKLQEAIDKVKDKLNLNILTGNITDDLLKQGRDTLAQLEKVNAAEADRVEIEKAISDIYDLQLGLIKTKGELDQGINETHIKNLESAKLELEQLQGLAKTDSQRAKTAQEILNTNQQIADLQKDLSLGDFAVPDLNAEGEKLAQETDKTTAKYLEDSINAQQQINELRIAGIENEFQRQQEIIQAEYEAKKANIDQLYSDRLITLEDYNKAQSDIDNAREQELSALQQDRFGKGLSAAKSIASALHNAFGDSSLINNLTRALEIAEAIATVIQSISIIGSIFSFGATAAVPAVKTGGRFEGGKFTPYADIPKFQKGTKGYPVLLQSGEDVIIEDPLKKKKEKFKVPPGYPNDSFPYIVDPGKRITVIPVKDTTKKMAAGGVVDLTLPDVRAGIQPAGNNIVNNYQDNNNTELLRQISDRIAAVSSNIRTLETRVEIINNAPDIDTQVRKNKRTENKLATRRNKI